MAAVQMSVPPLLNGARIRVATITNITSANNDNSAKVEHYVVCAAQLISSKHMEMTLRNPLNGGPPMDLVAFRIAITIVRNLQQIRSRVRDAVGLGSREANWLIERLTPIAWPEGVMGPAIKNIQKLDEEIETRQIQALKLALQAHKVAGFVIPSIPLSVFIHSPQQLGLGHESPWTIFDPWSGIDPISLLDPSMRTNDPLIMQQLVAQHPILSQSRWLLDGQRGRFHLPDSAQKARKPTYRANYPNVGVVISDMKSHPGVLTERITTYIPDHCQGYQATEYGTTYRLNIATAQPAPPAMAKQVLTFNQPGLTVPNEIPLSGHAPAHPSNILTSALSSGNGIAQGSNSTMLPLVPPFKMNNVLASTQPGLPVPNQIPVAGYAPTRSGNANVAVQPRLPVLDAERDAGRPAKRQRMNTPEAEPEAELPSARAANTAARGINTTARSPTGGNQAAAPVNHHSSRATARGGQLSPASGLPAMATQGVEGQANDDRSNKVLFIKAEPSAGPETPDGLRAQPTHGSSWHLEPANIDLSVLLQPPKRGGTMSSKKPR